MTFEKDNIKNARILVIDDDKDAQKLIVRQLTRAGFEKISVTDSAFTALHKIETGMTDLVLCDWYMPKVDGLQLLKSARMSRENIPFIMLTAESKKEKIIEAMRAGATSYIAKPFTKDDLFKQIKAALEKTP